MRMLKESPQVNIHADGLKATLNDDNQNTKIGGKTLVWTFLANNNRHLTRENVCVAKQTEP